jgi:Leucine-rich repeat (LRR) protein
MFKSFLFRFHFLFIFLSFYVTSSFAAEVPKPLISLNIAHFHTLNAALIDYYENRPSLEQFYKMAFTCKTFPQSLTNDFLSNLSNERIVEFWNYTEAISNPANLKQYKMLFRKYWQDKEIKITDLIQYGLSHEKAVKGPFSKLIWNDNSINADKIAAILKDNPTLTSLRLEKISANELIKIIAVLYSLHNLTHLYLDFNSIDTESAAEELCENLKRLSNITYLSMRANFILTKGTIALANAIKHLPNITHLYLQNNNIDKEQAKALMKALESLFKLKLLNLMFNKIEDEGTTYLAQVLTSLADLEDIDLSYNNISAKGAEVLIKALESLPNIEKLELKGNQISVKNILSNNKKAKFQIVY